jgi:hypothetical protein
LKVTFVMENLEEVQIRSQAETSRGIATSRTDRSAASLGGISAI